VKGKGSGVTLRHRLSLLRARFRLWLARRRGDTIVHFLHISKTGGTALRHTLRKQRPGPGYHAVFHSHEVTLADIPRGEKVVFFLRERCGRFVSGFLSRQRQGMPRYNVPWDAAERAAFDRFTSPEALALALSSDNPDARAAAIAAMRDMRLVRDPYSYWLIDADYLSSRLEDLFHVGMQETLQSDFECLRTRMGFAPGLALPADPVAAHRGTGDSERLEGEARRNIEDWYRADACLLEWCERYRQGDN